MSEPDQVDVVVVGAGAAGMYMVHKLHSMGLTVRCFEAGADVGGTWYWNRYPGARCDVESIDYSYSFDPELEQEWDWSERYATQPEILRYLRHVADRYGLRRFIIFSTRVVSARFDEPAGQWRVRTDSGETVSARFCVFATGSLSDVRVPGFPGLDEFTGSWYHTARWPHREVDFTGRRVGVIGTGSSGIQCAPVIARQAAHLYVFQRTANFSIPAQNQPHTPQSRAAYKATYAERRRKSRASGGGSPHETYPKNTLETTPEERRAIFERQWQLGGVLFSKTFPDQLRDRAANDEAVAFFTEKVRAMVGDPAIADLLLPNDHPIGTKRICTDTDYYQTFNRDNVTLVDVRSAPIERITRAGIRTAAAEYELDDIVFATGFDAMTGALAKIDIRGRDGLALRDAWSAGPRTYLGLMVAGFPNMFVVTGPGSPSVLANMILAAEQHVEWIAEAIGHLDRTGRSTIEPAAHAQDGWVDYCNELAGQTLFPEANSWYLGANVPGKPRVFMPFIGGLGAYREICAEVARDGYRGFDLKESV
ncbi:flavin-containing monooxygenase [Amycolatopsis taiwanensis]|uniref:(Cyclohexanone) monooxygenase n=1 Tax=Amycolatopsis taiwanensis TaxID=342230 RepID=A0A9W6VG07_9PSEU|nr:NAD(P)/FAD-dependent oxidoreductase [Amycolatopsis taiwanensis]GLY65439.1 putative (cyclohexanone) monooxygenase [Amycolatopsis taiwanensis]